MVQGKDVGDALVEAALAPIRTASGRLRDGAIADGIAGFSKAELLAGLQAGIRQAAKSVGFQAAEVEKLLSWDKLEPALDRLEAARTEAARAYQDQALSVGGLLTGLSRGTAVDVYRESGALALRNVAQRFVRDKELHRPLEALAVEIAAWEALIAQCGDILETSPLVKKSIQRKRIQRFVLAGIAIIAVTGFEVVSWSQKKVEEARNRVEAAINNQDPCKVETILAADAAHARPDQISRRERRQEACVAARAIAAREAACATLAKNFAAGKLTPEDVIQAKTAAPLLNRALESKLEAEDLLQTTEAMPCQDTPAGKEFFLLFAKTAAASNNAWASATKVSDEMRKALKTKDLEQTTTWRDELTRRAEPLAAKAILSGKPEDMTSGKTICEFQASFGVELGKKCTGLLAFMASRKL